jgi:hypothetical protein
MDIKVVGDHGEIVKENKLEEVEPSNPPVRDNQAIKQAVSDVFGLSSREVGMHSAAINTLIDYAISQSDDPTPENVKWAIRQLYLKVGTPPLGENVITYLSRYAYLAMEQNKISKELKKYEQFK